MLTRGQDGAAFTLALTAYNLIRLPKLLAAAGMSFRGRWSKRRITIWANPPISSSARRAGSSPWATSAAPSTVPAKAMPPSSTGQGNDEMGQRLRLGQSLRRRVDRRRNIPKRRRRHRVHCPPIDFFNGLLDLGPTCAGNSSSPGTRLLLV